MHGLLERLFEDLGHGHHGRCYDRYGANIGHSEVKGDRTSYYTPGGQLVGSSDRSGPYIILRDACERTVARYHT